MQILQKFNEGGPFMYFILLFALCTLVLIVERAIVLYFKVKPVEKHFRSKILEFLTKGDFKGAEAYAQSLSQESSIAKITEVACHLKGNAGGADELQSRMDEALTSEIGKVDKRTAFLAMFGNVATLLGLLGTISGMISSFSAVASANPADRATLLSHGISEAMNCTAFGLIVAIPALVAYAVFQNKTDRWVFDLTETTTRIYHDLIFLCEVKA